MEWMTRERAIRFYGIGRSTFFLWVQKYGVRKRERPDGIVYHSADLEAAEYRARHKGKKPPWQ